MADNTQRTIESLRLAIEDARKALIGSGSVNDPRATAKISAALAIMENVLDETSLDGIRSRPDSTEWNCHGCERRGHGSAGGDWLQLPDGWHFMFEVADDGDITVVAACSEECQQSVSLMYDTTTPRGVS